MTDKKLLELAAKAAGYTQKWNNFWRGMYNELPNDCWDSSSYWNPLTDDGDALRLAVKLQISQIYGKPCVAVCAFSRGTSNDNDPYTATRHAIVRAAAEIGKGK